MNAQATAEPADVAGRIAAVIEQYWGFSTLRPLQAEAITAGIDGRDSLVVLPTGGGKSLCYQVPPIITDRLDVVVSPLISLMKDQADGLAQCGYPAAAIHSNLSAPERQAIYARMRTGELRLLFVAPERLVTDRFTSALEHLNVRAFSIDEAHCISHWGHDFRPEYRQLASLRDRFPNASFHAYTATATPRVRGDIVTQLGLRDARVLVGTFDRPNLTYRIIPQVDVYGQVREIIGRHANEAVIVYCLARKETEAIAEYLQSAGVNAKAYHAGLERTQRTAVQDAFSAETLDVVVATVAFGMGIDRSNVRCVVHASIPRSVEHYQQETGRAGRDGLEAECVLLYSAADVVRWKYLQDKSAQELGSPPEAIEAQEELLRHMQGLCTTAECRHRSLTRYFGQTYEPDHCGACDVCLEEIDDLDDATDVARKILSAVARTEQRFGVGQIVAVLRGADTEAVRKWRHHELKTYGALKAWPEKTLTNLVYQLVDQNLLERSAGDRPIITLNDESWAVMRGEREVRLLDPGRATVRRSRGDAASWEGVDRDLFEHLRSLRREVAIERGVPAYVIFGDATLRELARLRPGSLTALRGIHGIGEKKLADFGERFLSAIATYCGEQNMAMDVEDSVTHARPRRSASHRPNPVKARAMELFARHCCLAEVVEETGRAASTVWGYLVEFIEHTRPDAITAWVGDETYQRVVGAAAATGADQLRPIHEALGGDVPYEAIRAVLAHCAAISSGNTAE